MSVRFKTIMNEQWQPDTLTYSAKYRIRSNYEPCAIIKI